MGVPVRLHICGNTKRIVEGMGQTGAEIIDLDFPTPLGHARRAMRETQVLLGNIDPVRELRDGTPASVEAALAECYRQAGAAYICGAGCESAARHAARQRGSHGAVRAQPLVKLELHPRAHQTLADQLFAAGVEFPCGGESACGGCKVRVLEGDVPVTATMRDALSENEIRDGWRLACCASAAGRVVVEVEQWSLRVLSDEASVPIEPRAGRGAAIDLGTTTLVVQVVDLEWRSAYAWRPRSTRRRVTGPT
jgi:ferredoxin